MRTPFFILSSGRSGSTLLASMLDMHPNLHVPVELWGLYTDLPRNLFLYGDLSKKESAHLLSEDLQRIGQLNEFGIEFDSDYFVRLLQAREPSQRSVIECFYETLLRESEKPRLGDKTPNNLPYIEKIADVFPEAKIIHLVRDGRDCALSSMGSRTGLNYRNVYELAVSWQANNMRAASYGGRNPDQYRLVRYEDLVTDARRSLEQLCEFLDEPFAEEMLNYRSGRFATANSKILSHHKNLGKDIIGDNVAKWRKGMTSNQVRVYDELAGDALETFAYSARQASKGHASRLLRLGYRAETDIRRVLRWLRRTRKGVWRAFCVTAKRLLGSGKRPEIKSSA